MSFRKVGSPLSSSVKRNNTSIFRVRKHFRGRKTMGQHSKYPLHSPYSQSSSSVVIVSWQRLRAFDNSICSKRVLLRHCILRAKVAKFGQHERSLGSRELHSEGTRIASLLRDVWRSMLGGSLAAGEQRRPVRGKQPLSTFSDSMAGSCM
ncbi:hypothetical protein I7I53_09265 [Histoplasma capsulatum var. duboisii H88]|uniref:Uncharacterized protein n=1 Tax=Ajellomyces capsulatus (strain H88) TaxID=544711 RepID=A0A8A1LAC7_AJEC8|nr:hypothetical protein I7I53_09265 [Histoplasma capsulatum var. duboisii H88]